MQWRNKKYVAMHPIGSREVLSISYVLKKERRKTDDRQATVEYNWPHILL